jgi:hypothetical protein
MTEHVPGPMPDADDDDDLVEYVFDRQKHDAEQGKITFQRIWSISGLPTDSEAEAS